MKEKKKYESARYISNRDLGMGSHRNYAQICVSLNERLRNAIACMELDTVFMLVRLLRDKQCVVNRKNKQFLDRFKDD